MDSVRNLSDRDVQSSGNTSAGTLTMLGDFEGEASVASLEAARQTQNNRDQQRWIGAVLPPIKEFLRLPKGWDTYNGEPLKLETGMFALDLISDVMNPRIPIPIVGPTASGGVQFEWHEGPAELELFVNAPYDCEVVFRNRITGEEQTAQITSMDFSPLMRSMVKLQAARQAAA